MKNSLTKSRYARVLSILLAISLIVTSFSTSALAAIGDKWTETADKDVLINDTVTKIADNVYEHEVITNNDAGNKQKIDFLTEIKPSETLKVVAGYGENSADSWTLLQTSKQAAAYERDNPGHTVVTAINADFFNMATGEPLGALVMEGEVKHPANGRCYFGITKDGEPIISNNSDLSNLQTAVGGDMILIDNGKIMSDESSYGQMEYTRTAIGYKADGTIVTFVTYGNRAPVSCGRTYHQMAQMLQKAGCIYALALDGGGSSTLLSRPEGTTGLQVRNNPVDGAERAVSSSLFIVSTAEQTGIFSHAQLTPNNEVYTPGSKVQFEANGVDTAGFEMSLPDGVKYALNEDSKSLGSIDENTGLFTANKATGIVTVNLVLDNKVIGSTAVEIAEPDSIYFNNDEASIGFDDESGLGLVVRNKGRNIHYNVDDIEWNFEVDDEYAELVNEAAKKATAIIGNLNVTAKNTGTDGNKITIKIDEGEETNSDVYVYVNGEKKEEFKSLSGIDALAEQSSSYVIFSKENSEGSNSLEKTDSLQLSGGKTGLEDFLYFENNKIFSKGTTIKGVVTASYGNVSGNITVIIGKLPTVVWDFEDIKDENGNVTSTAEDYYIGSSTSPGILNHSNYKRGGNESIEIVSEENEEPVRFGKKALKLNYDFRNCGEVTEGACIGSTEAMSIPGIPTGIGVWVYAPEGVGIDWPNEDGQSSFWLRGYVKDGTGNNVPYDFTLEPKNQSVVDGTQKPGIYWEGWKYLEADLTKLQAPFSINSGMTFRLMFVHGTKMGTRTANSIYFDNFQFVYGANIDDIDNPVIDSITVNGKELKEGDTITSNLLNVESIFHDVENKYTTGIEESNIKMYVDGVNVVDNDKYEFAKDGNKLCRLFNLYLRDGEHSITVSVKDAFKNEAVLTRNFTVKGDSATPDNSTRINVVNASEPMLGGKMLLNIVASGDDVLESITVLKLGANFKNYDVQFSDKYDGAVKYNNLDKTITITANRKPESTTSEDEYVIATVKVDVPSNLNDGDTFNYIVKSGSFTTADGMYDTYSQKEAKIPVVAEYQLYAEPVIIGGDDCEITVKDSKGNLANNVNIYKVSNDELVGVTDVNGKLTTDKFNGNTGVNKIYAKDDKGLLSFHYKVSTFLPQGDVNGTAFNIRFNLVLDSATQKNITWMSNPLADAGQTFMYAEAGTESWNTVQVATKRNVFDSDFGIVNNNKVFLENLKADTEYDYKIACGEATSEVKKFKTSKFGKTSQSFFILGDIQDPDKTNLKGILNEFKDKDFEFGVQIGDAIDQANDYSDWSALGDLLGEKLLGDMEVLSVMGNHEYYGDEDASIASDIYNNPNTKNGSYYSIEKDNIYLAVINYCANSSQVDAAAQWLKEDASKSDAIWKIVLSHQPPYYTNSVGGNEPVYDAIPSVCEEAGIDVMFSGHDHTFARTNPLKGDEIDEKNGVVYYICGAIGKKRYPVSTMDKFDYSKIFATPIESFTSSYLTIDSNKEEMTIKMWKYEDGKSQLFDTFKIESECKKNGHDQVYVPAENIVKCERCNDIFEDFTGDIKDTNGNEYNLISGKKQIGWKTVGEEFRYYDENGIREKVTADVTPSTCIIDGHCIYTSESGKTYREEFNDAGGHEYENQSGDFICSKCGWQRVKMSDLDVKLNYYACTYTGNPRTPSTTAINPITGETLKKVNPYRDYSSKYSNNVDIGTATVTLTAAKYGVYVNMNEWRGNYEGSVTIKYEIRPDAPTNAAITYKDGKDILGWTAAKYADEYVIYQSVNGGDWKEIDTTKKNEYVLPETDKHDECKYRVVSRTAGTDGKKYESINSTEATALYITVETGYNDDGRPTLKWNGPKGATYSVYRSTSQYGKYDKVFDANTGKTYTHLSATDGKKYYYKVEASLYGKTIVSDIVENIAICAKPEVTALNDESTGKPQLTWNTVKGASQYEVWVKEGANGTYKKYKTTTTSFTHTDALLGKAYYYKVKAICADSAANSEFCDEVSVTCILAQPQVNITQIEETGRPQLTWNDVEGADRYEIWRKVGTDGTYKKFYVAKGTKFINTSVETEKTYFYKVRAIATRNSNINSAFSSEQSVLCSSAYRLYGDNRYQTSFEVADALKDKLGITKFNTIVVASGSDYPDALSAGYLANKKNAPIIMVDKNNVSETNNYISNNLAQGGTVYLLGGVAVVPDETTSGINGCIVKRLEGKSRYETNLAILKETGFSGGKFLVCTGRDFADGLSASAIELPILLVDNKLTEEQITLLNEFGSKDNNKAYIIGGEGVISENVEAALGNYAITERIGGANRYDTSRLVADKFFNNSEYAVVAYAHNFPDGICAGPLAQKLGAPLLLTSDGNSAQSKAYCKAEEIYKGYVLGGKSIISDNTIMDILSLKGIPLKY